MRKVEKWMSIKNRGIWYHGEVLRTESEKTFYQQKVFIVPRRRYIELAVGTETEKETGKNW